MRLAGRGPRRLVKGGRSASSGSGGEAPASLTTIHLSKIAKREDALESSWTLAYKEASSEADSRVLKRKTRGPTAKIQSAQSMV